MWDLPEFRILDLECGVVFIFRLFFLQVINDKWRNRAKEITYSEKNIYPPRGLIYDRNGKLLVSAEQVYDIMITPKEIGKTDTLKICNLFKLTKEELFEKIDNASKGYNVDYKPSIFIEAMPKEEYARISTNLKRFKGFKAIRTSQRGYPSHSAAHLLGYIRKISKEQYDTIVNLKNPYKKNDYIGITGLEKIYENELRGSRGKVYYLQDYAGNIKEEIDKEYAYPGYNLQTTIDLELQVLGEKLMKNKIGCIVAIEPKSGEILSMVSSPSYDPSLLSGKEFSANYRDLSRNDSLKPLLNRPVYNASYRPGSIFKLVQALIAMQHEVIRYNSSFVCNKAIIGCHSHEPPLNIGIAIKHSCNPYFYQVYKRLILKGINKNIFIDSRIGLEQWKKDVNSFGLGVKLDTDIPGVKSGRVPDVDFYDNKIDRGGGKNGYGKKRWAFSTIYSNSIGEGEIGVSPLQMANLAAIIANKGFYITPHLVKSIGNVENSNSDFYAKKLTNVASKYFTPVIDAMEQVVLDGTGKGAQVEGVSVCGKTGTVENKNFNDHSVFIAFAPKEDPKIAIAVYVEYGNWGGTWAAPIASVLIEYYLKRKLGEVGTIKKEKIEKAVILNKNSDFTF